MTSSAVMGRPKIDGLTPLNLRIVKDQLDALDRIVAAERAKRGDPALNRTDIIREAIAAFIRKHDPK